MSTDTVAITSREQFQQSIASLGDLHAQLATKIDDNTKVLESVTAAATPTGPAAGAVAPVYGQSIDAVKTSLDGVNAQVAAAGTSVQTAMSDMSALLQGLSGIDDAAAADVKKA